MKLRIDDMDPRREVVVISELDMKAASYFNGPPVCTFENANLMYGTMSVQDADHPGSLTTLNVSFKGLTLPRDKYRMTLILEPIE